MLGAVVSTAFLVVSGIVAQNAKNLKGGMLGRGFSGGFGWMWIPTIRTLGVGILLGWANFGKKT